MPSLSAYTNTFHIQKRIIRASIFCIVIALTISSCSSPSSLQKKSSLKVIDSSSEVASEIPNTEEELSLSEILSRTLAYDRENSYLPPHLAFDVIRVAASENRADIVEATVEKINFQAIDIHEYAKITRELIGFRIRTRQYDLAQQYLNENLFLSKLPLMELDDQVALSILRAKTHFGLKNYLASAQERIFIEDFIHDKAAKNDNANGIWSSLLRVKPEGLITASQNPSNASLRGWCELALIHQNLNQNIKSEAKAAKKWLKDWPKHSAVETQFKQINALSKASRKRTKTIGIFLPLTGNLSLPGKAIRDGIAAAHFSSFQSSEDPQSAPSLLFYDTAKNNIEQLYEQARSEGVDLVIGPLEKNRVKALFTMHTDTPILTLNFVPNNLPPPINIVQFGLATEDEATQLAYFADSQGFTNPLILSTSKDWASRATSSFLSSWQSLGHMHFKQQTLSISDNFSDEISSSFSIPESETRRISIQNATANLFEFIPRRRQDFDFVVLFAGSAQAKAIKPLLAYHYAGRLPVMGSSHAFDGKTDGSNVDLNGLIFSEMPYLIENKKHYLAAPTHYQNNKSLKRLYAMGVDAYFLYPKLEQLKADENRVVNANTGRLSIKDNRVVRELPVAEIKGGRIIQPTHKKGQKRSSS